MCLPRCSGTGFFLTEARSATVLTLKNWKAGIAGPVKHAGIFDGEEYDAREPMGYECVDELSIPEENTDFLATSYLRTEQKSTCAQILALAPVRAYAWKNIEGAKENEFGKVIITREFTSGTEMTVSPGETLVVDFGQIVPVYPFVFKACRGTVLTCLPAELLNDGNGAKIRGMDGPEGSCHRENLRISPHRHPSDYTLLPEILCGLIILTAPFLRLPLCRHNCHRKCRHQVVKVHTRHFHHKANWRPALSPQATTFVNKLISNTYWGQLSNYLFIPTDCPQRDERLGWTADTQVFAETGTFFATP